MKNITLAMEKDAPQKAYLDKAVTSSPKDGDPKKLAKEQWTRQQIQAIMQFEKIVKSSMDGLWVADATGTILHVNHVGLQNTDFFSKDEVINRNMQELLAQGLFDRSIILEVIRTSKPHMVIHKLRDGRQLLRIANPVFYNGSELALVVVHELDMTELYLLKSNLPQNQSLAAELPILDQPHEQEKLRSRINVRSESMLKVLDRAYRVSRVDSTVLIQGESGVGKGYFAKLIHQISARSDQPFIRVDCGSIPEQLIEAELFGYEGGAFTGAQASGKPGYFELADGGTLFLDEIGELPFHIQVKLLRFLEENQLMRVGGTRVRYINTRILTATNRDLSKMVAEEGFRKDLYYRINVIHMHIPPLRDRMEDIPVLAYHFLNHFNEKYGKNKAIFPKAIECLCSYDFPGNIRELSNLMERLVVLHPEEKIDWDALPSYMRSEKNQAAAAKLPDGWNLKQAVSSVERQIISKALDVFGSQRKAAKSLGIDHSTLARKIKKLGMQRGA